MIRQRPNLFDKCMTREKTCIPGLKYVPEMESILKSQDVFTDFIPLKNLSGNGQFTIANSEVLRSLIQDIKDPKLFVEIGTASVYTGSSTEIFALYKKEGTKLITIDIATRTLFDDLKNVEIVTSDSTDPLIIEKIKSIGEIDLLFIDGDHSVNAVFREYEFYRPLMSSNGIIVLHDTTMHPGPYLLMDAIDEDCFRKEVYCEDIDYGIGVIWL